MKRFNSIRLKMKRSFADRPFPGLSISSSPASKHTQTPTSIHSLLLTSINPHKHGPTAQQLHQLAKYTLQGEVQTLKLLHLILEHLSLCQDQNDPIELNKILGIIHYIFLTGNKEFYYSFVNGQGLWKLRTLISTSSDIDDKLMNRVRDLLVLCDDEMSFWERRREHSAVLEEIHSPISRHSFEGKRRSFESYPEQNHLRASLHLERIAE